MAPRRRRGSDTVAVVLSGAAARGAFQAGALAELLPALEREGLVPRIWLGTSAGSINAVLWASTAHRGTVAAVKEVLDIWRRMSDDDVFRSLLSLPSARRAAQYVLGAALGLGPGTTSLLDTTPLQRTAGQVLEPAQLAANVADGVVSALGVVATRTPAESDRDVTGTASGRSVLFLDEHVEGTYAGDPDRALDVVRSSLTVDHVLASSAVPVAFAPVRIRKPGEAAGWYIDGGVRLNTPLHPAIGLGATRIVLISATATTYGVTPGPDPATRSPDVADAAAQVLNAALADRTTEDLILLRRTNRLVAQAASAGQPRRLTTSSGRPYRGIDLMEVSPPAGEMGRIASEVFDAKTHGVGRFGELDNWLLGRLIRGAGNAFGRGELLSYLFFNEDYFGRAIDLGRKTAAAALARGWER